MNTRLKICGVTRAIDVAACHDLGVDAIGINLWRGSKRGLSLRDAETMLAEAGRAPTKVGVFVDHSPAQIEEAARRLALDAVQWHGDGPVDDVAALGLPYVWVIRGTPVLTALRVPQPAPVWILLDAWVPGFGGAGVSADWSFAAQAVRHFAPLPVWLAGGLTPENAAEAIASVSPAGLDVASGAEGTNPPAKDRERMQRLAAVCRGDA